MGLQTGMVFAVPIPTEHAGDGEKISSAITTAVHEARYEGITTFLVPG
jgi:pseudouridine-5'-phosphate glycosidase